jgi:hypothetical protein
MRRHCDKCSKGREETKTTRIKHGLTDTHGVYHDLELSQVKMTCGHWKTMTQSKVAA